MAISIKSIPVLKSKVAEAFIENANKTYHTKKGTIDFSKQTRDANKILKKAKMY